MALQEIQLKPGQTVADRYTILSVVGRGGSATVYRADDEVLGERVALKALPRGADALRELQLARRVSHPGICRVHDIVQLEPGEGMTSRAGTVLISMELLEGDTLRTRLHRDGRFDVHSVLGLLSQLGHALQAAHRAGVVHGDLSARNIVLVDDGAAGERVVITDFGLSSRCEVEVPQSDPPISEETLAAPVAGTLVYMAPEQLRGAGADTATDIYSLGCLAFEMLTGAPPFGGVGRPPILNKLLEPAPSLTELRPDVPAALASWIQLALSRTPDARPAGLRPLLDAVGETENRRSIARVATWSVATITVCAVVGWSLYQSGSTASPPASGAAFREARTSSPTAQRAGVAVLPVEHDETAAAAFLAQRLQRALRRELARSPRLSVLSPASTTVLARLLDPADRATRLELAHDLGTEQVIAGTIRAPGIRSVDTADIESIEVELRLLSLTTGEILQSAAFDAHSSRAFSLETEARKTLTDWFDLAAPDTGSTVADVTEAAAREYGRAHQFFAGTYGIGDVGQRRDGLERAARLFRSAASIAPAFAESFAWAALCEIELSLLPGSSGDQQHLSRAKSEARRALEEDPTQPEALAVLAYVEGMDGDLSESLRLFGRVSELAPGAALPPALEARVLERHRRWSDAAAAAELAMTRDPFSPLLMQLAAGSQLILRRYQRAEELLEIANRRFPEVPLFYATRAVNHYYWTGSIDVSLRLVEAAGLRDADFLSPWFLMIGGRWQEAQRRLQAISLDAWDAELYQPKDLLLGFTELNLGLEQEARASLERALGLLERRSKPSPDLRLEISRSTVLALLGRDSDAKELLLGASARLGLPHGALEHPSLTQAIAWNHALVGQPDVAMGLLTALFEGPANISAASLRTDPRWRLLRDRDDFGRLIERAELVEGQSVGALQQRARVLESRSRNP